ncbi:MAG: insulinase family protein [Phaeodactylibacter sp.]|nr:insulinase family protein [Phaeodactylibacter sp.]MCB9272976.1 insulinase family protein [Lewinellaceae bacterium]
MINRKKAPKIHDIEMLSLPEIPVHRLDNGMTLYEIQMGTQEVAKLELAFMAGRPFESKLLAARATAGQIKEGSRHYTGHQIAEQMDFYGCSLSFPFHMDTSNVILYSLNKHFGKALPLLEDMLAGPAFPENELQAFIRRNQRRLEVDLSKNDVIAYRQITELLFGAGHPYGYNSMPETYAALQREDLAGHFNRLFNSSNGAVFLSGKTTPEMLDMVNESLSRAIRPGHPASAILPDVPQQPETQKITRPDTVQAAIRIGRRLFNRHHPDYFGMYVLNTILGGYFGSRLMANIREEKGFTYNIYSMLDTMHYDGCFYIGTEVGNEFVQDTLDQIYHEMRLLQEEPVDEEELAMVRNYLMGNFLTMLDGPFNVSEVVRTQVVEGLPMSYFEELTEKVRTITADELQRLAQRYLSREDMWEVVVGV